MGMKIVTGKQMQEIDRLTIEERHIPEQTLMENAGAAVVDEIIHFDFDESNTIAILCGPGNNGGDGFVIARLLHEKNYTVVVIVTSSIRALKGEAANMCSHAIDAGVEIIELDGEFDHEQRTLWRQSVLIVDALLGTGITQPARGVIQSIIQDVNSMHKQKRGQRIIAVDVPSGWISEPDIQSGDVMECDVTVCLGLPKWGLTTAPGWKYTGDLLVRNIGFPPDLLEAVESSDYFIDIKADYLPDRPLDGHKGTFGHVLLIAGSAGKTGAATLAAEAAYRIGAGLVTVAVPEDIFDIMSIKLTEAMVLALPMHNGVIDTEAAQQRLIDFFPKATVIGFGPGVGTSSEMRTLLELCIREFSGPMIIDADGLNLLARDTSILSGHKQPIICTPHPGEMARLAHISTSEQIKNGTTVDRCASDYEVIMVYKRAHTTVHTPVGQRYHNCTGSNALAKGGTGDVLTGIISGLAAQYYKQKRPMLMAACAGVYLHGLAAQLVVDEDYDGIPHMTSRSVIATDVIDAIHGALIHVETRID